MKKLLIFIIGAVVLFINTNVCAQQSRCGTNLDLDWLRANSADHYQRFIDLENFTKSYINNQDQNSNRLINGNGLIIIPVVVHVLHYGESIGTGFNISLARIQSQIQVLNEDFRRLNADAVNTPAAFLSVAADLQIEFRLACIDPNGNPTDGVVRKQTGESQFLFNKPKRPDGSTNEEAIGIKTLPNGSPPWPTDRYLNMWVCNLVDVAGYSQLPGWYSAYPDYDGVVISKESFGRPSENSIYNKGRTATHEIGHWLNLIHIWGDPPQGQTNLNCIYDDEVTDTPKQIDFTFGESNNGCPSYPYLEKRCNLSDPSTMFMNYMDLVTDACYNLFTNGQKLRARALFASGGPREQQLNNWFKVRQTKNPIRCNGVVYSSPICLQTTWTVLSGPATLTPGPGPNQATLTATGTGTVVIRATSGNYTTDDNIEVTTEPPPFTGYYTIWSDYHNPGYQWTLYNNNSPIWLGANKGFQVTTYITTPEFQSIVWTRASNSYLFSYNYSQTTFSFWGTSGSSAYQQRNGIFNVTAQTSCGTFNGTYTWPVVVAGWLRLMVSPNPATDNIIVSIDEKESKIKSLKTLENVSITLQDIYTNITVKRWEFRNSQNKFYLNVADLKKGHYILILRRGKDQGVKQILIE